MRKHLTLKLLIVLGLALAAMEAWWTASHRHPVVEDDDFPGFPAIKARAKEINPAASTIATVPVTNWSAQLGAVLTSTGSTTNHAVSLLAMFPNLPAEGQLEAVQHASRLLPGEYFNTLGAQMTNPGVAPAVRRAIFADLLTRPNSIKLPWLIELAQAGEETQSDEALFLLQSHLQENYGTDWNAWRERAAVWLSQNPD